MSAQIGRSCHSKRLRGRHLIEGLKNPTVVRDKKALIGLSFRPVGVNESIQKAITNTTEWSGRLSQQS